MTLAAPGDVNGIPEGRTIATCGLTQRDPAESGGSNDGGVSMLDDGRRNTECSGTPDENVLSVAGPMGEGGCEVDVALIEGVGTDEVFGEPERFGCESRRSKGIVPIWFGDSLRFCPARAPGYGS
jgi:hypothetical protein